jgi:hypothetical protein
MRETLQASSSHTLPIPSVMLAAGMEMIVDSKKAE